MWSACCFLWVRQKNVDNVDKNAFLTDRTARQRIFLGEWVTVSTKSKIVTVELEIKVFFNKNHVKYKVDYNSFSFFACFNMETNSYVNTRQQTALNGPLISVTWASSWPNGSPTERNDIWKVFYYYNRLFYKLINFSCVWFSWRGNYRNPNGLMRVNKRQIHDLILI